MGKKEPVAEKLPSNSEHAAPTAWVEGRRLLDAGSWYWLATMHTEGRPHVRPLLAVWLEDALYFSSSASSRKAKNLVHNPLCTITVATERAHLVVEGTAARVYDEATLQRVAAVYASKYDWHVSVRDHAFHASYGAPTAGPPPYEVYQVTPSIIYGFGTDESFSPTRWRFS